MFKPLHYLTLISFFACSVQALADGYVPKVQGYVYTTTCRPFPITLGGKGSTPSEAYAAACKNWETGWGNHTGCFGTSQTKYGSLGARASDWRWVGNGEEALFTANYSQVNTFPPDMPNCPADSNTTYVDGRTIYREAGLTCPPNSHFTADDRCECDNNSAAQNNACVPTIPRIRDKPWKECPVGDPIYPLTGSSTLDVELGTWFGESASASYDSRYWQPNTSAYSSYQQTPAPSFGTLWRGSYHKRLVRSFVQGAGSVQVSRGRGTWVSFQEINGSYVADADVNDKLTYSTTTGWLYRDLLRGAIETYDDNGRLTSRTTPNGKKLIFTYSSEATDPAIAPSPNLLIKISDPFGRKVAFSYAADLTTKEISDASNAITKFYYDLDNRLTAIIWPDGTNKEFVYENSSFPWALTGVLDENQARTTTFGLDNAGRAIDTQQAGGANHYSVTYATPPSWTVTETPGTGFVWRDYYWVAPVGTVVTSPNGQTSNLATSNVQGMPRLTNQSQPAGSGCSASSSSTSYDANSNKSWTEDFNGHRSCFAYDLSRNLETSRVEGLVAGTACTGPLGTSAALPLNSRKTSTQWHPDWQLPAKVAQPKRITTYVYNGQTDPFTNQTASCAAGAALLPDGKPIVVLCKQVEQATTDANGSQGFSASLDPGVPTRIQRWTYNMDGQVLTYADPLNFPTTYAYYPDTTADHTKGDLFTVTNAKQQAVQYTKYNAAGQWLEMRDLNNVLTVREFDTRQRLKTVTTAGSITSYTYWPTGLLKTVTLPDSSITYGYDDAHRLKSITDNRGNSITYTLDGSGTRTGEAIKDPTGTLAKTLTRVPDALNRIQQVIGRE